MATDVPYTPDEVADRLAILDVISRYVHAIDAYDWDRLDDVFLPDTRFDLSSAGAPVGTWAEVIKPFYAANIPTRFVRYMHVYANTLIEFSDERQEATTRSKVINPCGTRDADGVMHYFETTGVYHDKWHKTPDGWRIVDRVWENGWAWGDYPMDTLPGDFDRAG